VNDDGLLKMSELAEASGVSAGTIKHYLREGLLGDGEGVVRTSRNMAYYPPSYVERIQLIKRLQEERFMPLRLIRQTLEEDPERARQIVEAEDRIIDRLLAAEDASRVDVDELIRRYEVPRDALDRLAELGVLSAAADGYDADDVAMVAALSRFRAGGYDEALGFTVYETVRYREALQPLVEDEVRTMLGRLAASVDEQRAVEIIEAGTEPLRELIGAMHSKLMRAELRRPRE
jgi:DNA-binding transcriptional MerR regulator